eukprot:COSAG01_NODE_71211_length_256_cov_1.305732_2_plen_39_part_01
MYGIAGDIHGARPEKGRADPAVGVLLPLTLSVGLILSDG